MKSTLITLILLCSLHVNSQTNTYFENNPMWQISSSCAVGYPCIQQERKIYTIDGDTTITGLTYKKLFLKGEGNLSWMSNPPAAPGCTGTYFYIDTFPRYFVRSEGKKMFIRTLNETDEQLLFDFDLEIGDSLPVSFNNYFDDISVVAIDSIYTSNGYYKRFELTGNTWSQFLIEGIGHEKGLLEPLNQALECGYELTCFSLTDTSYFPTIGITCDIAVGLTELEQNKFLPIYPNPFSSNTTIHVNHSNNEVQLHLTDMLGKKWDIPYKIEENKLTLERDNLPTGMYSFEIFENAILLGRGKVIVID